MTKPEKMKLLLVEDNVDEIDTYRKSIDIFGQNNNLDIDVQVKKSLDTALGAISSHFDAAIVDIRLEGDISTEEPGGEILINRLLKEFRIPTFVYTGTPNYTHRIEEKENLLFKKYIKGEVVIKDILKEIKVIFDSGITRIIGRRGLIEEKLDDIFWKHIANNLDLRDLTSSSEKKILRYIAAHLQEYLELDESGGFDKYTTAEVFIHPPIKNRVYTGSILRKTDSDDNFIVLTPACDLAQQKTKNVVIASIECLRKDGIFKQNLNIIKKPKNTDKKKEEAKDVLNKIIGNNFSNKYYFLPFTKFFKGGLINFQKLITVSPEELKKSYEPIASVTAPFLKDIIVRFSFYYSRQGSPDLNNDEIFDILTSEGIQ